MTVVEWLPYTSYVALFLSGMPCQLCGQPKTGDQALFSTWGVWLPQTDPLQKFCDAALHWDCYARWPERPRFARTYFDFWVSEEPQNPYWHCVYVSDAVFVEVNPRPDVASTWVILSPTGSRVEVPLSNWKKWLDQRDDGAHAIEETALASAKEELTAALPTPQSVRAAIDLTRKPELYARLEAQHRAEREHADAKRKADLAHNEACRAAAERIAKNGLTCPHCGTTGRDFRLAERRERRSIIICRTCGWTVDPQQVQ